MTSSAFPTSSGASVAGLVFVALLGLRDGGDFGGVEVKQCHGVKGTVKLLESAPTSERSRVAITLDGEGWGGPARPLAASLTPRGPHACVRPDRVKNMKNVKDLSGFGFFTFFTFFMPPSRVHAYVYVDKDEFIYSSIWRNVIHCRNRRGLMCHTSDGRAPWFLRCSWRSAPLACSRCSAAIRRSFLVKRLRRAR